MDVGSINHPRLLTAKQLADRLNLPESWVRDQTRSRATDPIPCLRFGKYVRFNPDDPRLVRWIEKHRDG